MSEELPRNFNEIVARLDEQERASGSHCMQVTIQNHPELTVCVWLLIFLRGGTVHKIHGSVHITVLLSRFLVRFGIH